MHIRVCGDCVGASERLLTWKHIHTKTDSNITEQGKCSNQESTDINKQYPTASQQINNNLYCTVCHKRTCLSVVNCNFHVSWSIFIIYVPLVTQSTFYRVAQNKSDIYFDCQSSVCLHKRRMNGNVHVAPKTSVRACRDPQIPGYWRQLQVSCVLLQSCFQHHPGKYAKPSSSTLLRSWFVPPHLMAKKK